MNPVNRGHITHKMVHNLSGPQNLFIKTMIWLSLLWLLPTAIANAGASGGAANFYWIDIFIGFAGGLAFFLYGMEKMSSGMKSTAGDKMRGKDRNFLFDKESMKNY